MVYMMVRHDSTVLLSDELIDARMEQLYQSVSTESRSIATVPAVSFFMSNIVFQVIVPLLTEVSVITTSVG